MVAIFPPGPPFYPTPLITSKIKVLKTMPIWVFRQAQKFGKLPESWFQVSAKLCLGSRSKNLFEIHHSKTTYLQNNFFYLLPKPIFAET